MGCDWLSLGQVPTLTNHLWPAGGGGITGMSCSSPDPVDTRGAGPSLELRYWVGSREKVPSTRDLSSVTQLENGMRSLNDSYVLSILLYFRIIKLW